MTKIRKFWYVVGTGNRHYNEAAAIAEFRANPEAVRVVMETEALLRRGGSEEALAFAGVPKAGWTNRDSVPVVVVERGDDGRERWPA